MGEEGWQVDVGWRLEGEGVVVLEEELDGEVLGVIYRQFASSPSVIHGEVKEFPNSALRDISDCLSNGCILVRPPEEPPTTTEGSVKELVCCQLSDCPGMPLRNTGKGLKVALLKLLDNSYRYANSEGNAVWGTAIVASMANPLGNVTITKTREARVSAIRNCTVGFGVISPFQFWPRHSHDGGVEVARFAGVPVG